MTTTLLKHTVTHSNRHSFRPKSNNHSIKNSISLEFTWAKLLKLFSTFSPSFTDLPFCFKFDSLTPSNLLSSPIWSLFGKWGIIISIENLLNTSHDNLTLTFPQCMKKIKMSWKRIAFNCKIKTKCNSKYYFKANLLLSYFPERLYITELDFSALAEQNCFFSCEFSMVEMINKNEAKS